MAEAMFIISIVVAVIVGWFLKEIFEWHRFIVVLVVGGILFLGYRAKYPPKQTSAELYAAFAKTEAARAALEAEMAIEMRLLLVWAKPEAIVAIQNRKALSAAELSKMSYDEVLAYKLDGPSWRWLQESALRVLQKMSLAGDAYVAYRIGARSPATDMLSPGTQNFAFFTDRQLDAVRECVGRAADPYMAGAREYLNTPILLQ